MLLWRLRVLPAFDEDVAAGRQLNADLRRLGQMRGSGGQVGGGGGVGRGWVRSGCREQAGRGCGCRRWLGSWLPP